MSAYTTVLLNADWFITTNKVYINALVSNTILFLL